MTITKKTTLGFLLGIAAFAPAFAFATSPTVDGATVGTTAATTATTSTTTANVILKTLKDYGLDQMAYMLAQKLGEKMATLAINKTTGGASADKDPNYVKDFGMVLSKIEQDQLDILRTRLTASGNPFANQIAGGLVAPGSEFDVLPRFTLGETLKYGGDWETAATDISTAGIGGWDYYTQLAMPQNTPIGSSMLAWDSLANNIADKKEAETLKLTSSGFLPNSKCNVSIAQYKNNISALAGSAQEQVFDTPEQAAAYQEQLVQQQNQTLGELTQDTAGCVEEMINNPVATTQVLTNEAGKFGMDMTKNINGWGQIVAGVFASLFNGFVDKGLTSLKGDYGQVKKANIGGPEQVAAAGSNFLQVPTNIIDLRADLERSIDAAERNITAIKALREELIKVPARLAFLDMCLPGPDILGLDKRLDAYYSQQTEWLHKNSSMGSDEKRNVYQGLVLSMLERDYGIGRAEMAQDMIDDGRNIPGAGAIRSTINRFSSRKSWWSSSADDLTRSTDALSQLRQVNSQLKTSLTDLAASDPANFGWINTLPPIPFTTSEWDLLPQAEQDALYAWTQSLPGQTVPTQSPSQAQKGKKVISVVWDVWENPENFLTTDAWSDETADGKSATADAFLVTKNKIRQSFNAIQNSIPSEYEIGKNEQQTQSLIQENAETDRLIHDCDKMRELIVGDSTSGIPAKLGSDVAAFRADLIQNKDVYFQSEQIKNSLTLPSILTYNRTWQDEGCRPNSQVVYQVTGNNALSSGQNSGDHSFGYSCYGKFGYVYGVQQADACTGIPGLCDFKRWIDAASNIYQNQPFSTWPTELYWKSRTLKFTPDLSAYGNGWTIQDIGNEPQTPDGGKQRKLFCRFSSVLGEYTYRSAVIDNTDKKIVCSSKWADLSIAEAIAMFIGSGLY